MRYLADPYFRVADVAWDDPLDTSWSMAHGGRWNPPQGFGALYTNSSVVLARAQVRHLHRDDPYEPEDLEESVAPILVEVAIPDGEYGDAVTAEGLAQLGLPNTYPHDLAGGIVEHDVCQQVGARLFDSGVAGIRCRSAAVGAPDGDHELAWFARADAVAPERRGSQNFAEWYYGDPGT